MAKCKWEKLRFLSLNDNPINDCSIDSLSCTYYPIMNRINLCKITFILGEIPMTHLGTLMLAKLTTKDVSTNYEMRDTRPKIMEEVKKFE